MYELKFEEGIYFVYLKDGYESGNRYWLQRFWRACIKYKKILLRERENKFEYDRMSTQTL